ncbi:1-aminocyclopropane-1-carboxylate deaminase/D-cysteine desulfhydrase [Nocardioides daejeonensis]|uniref:1-aminocyclopropane-1-carboxylate deaminase/D-cysteine desulfhydrase n=1 Tax=Nocardioides daejeonensis TaxID=1046556 RepID=UPI0013A561DE|nr:pyridoxal-phosphate dependent enzyme [Nocardioides daejeonensis]
MTRSRHNLATLPTPVQQAPRLAEALGVAGRLLVKRDDLTGFAVAGNKARPLEYLLAEALGRGADVLVTGGTPGSNFCQAAAAAAAGAGMECVLIYAGPAQRPQHPNHLAARAWGARVEWTGDPDRSSVDTALTDAAAELTAAGRRPYVAPRGGSTARGALGFHQAAAELATQVDGPATVVLATGSGGTTAGLIAGSVALGRRFEIHGASVSRAPEQARGRVLELARGCAELAGTAPPEAADVRLVDARGPGHAQPSTLGAHAAQVALTTMGIVLDPVYTAKALGALPAVLGEQIRDPRLTTIFWHTGGLLDAVAGWEHA